MIEYISYQFHNLDIEGDSSLPTAVVRLKVNDKETIEAAVDRNSPNALFKAFCRASKIEFNLIAYQIRERYRGGNSIGRASVRIGIDKKEMRGFGKDVDSRKAFLLALIDATNRFLKTKKEEVDNGTSGG